MPRPREFDEAEVLERATQWFWVHGYEGASVRDLATKMGITGASLYNAYGDKRTLYRVVLDRYAEQALGWCVDALDSGQPPRAALQGFFAVLASDTAQDLQRRGCLVVNAGLEMAPHDPDFQAVVAAVFEQIEALFRRCVERGQADGSISARQPAEDIARLLLATMLGVRVLARTRPDAPFLEGLVRSVNAILQP